MTKQLTHLLERERLGAHEQGLWHMLERRGVSRHEFLKFCTAVAALLAVPVDKVFRIAAALENPARPPVIWLEFQDCAGCTESFLRASRPTVADIVLDVLSVDYHGTIMAATGRQAEEAKQATIEAGDHLVVVEGSIPTKHTGLYSCVGGRSAADQVEEAARDAAAVIAVGDCANFGGIPAAYPNPTGAIGVRALVKHIPVVNLSGCPVNAVTVTATIVHYLTFGSLPALDSSGRPLFALSERIHAIAAPYNDGTNWPIGAGHGCIGCSEPRFWDTMSPFYWRLPEVPGLGAEATVDETGLGLKAAAVVGVAAHVTGSAVRRKTGASAEKPPEP